MPTPSAKQPPPRIQIQDVRPQVDCGRYPVKATEGDSVDVAATIFKDGHDILRAVVRYRAAGSRKWLEAPLEPLGNDRWAGSFRPAGLGRWQFTIEAWVDRYATLLDELDRKLAAGQTELAGELSEAEALFGPGDLDAWRAVAAKQGAKDRHGRTSLAKPLEVDVERHPRAVRRLVRALPPQLGRLQGRPEGRAAARRARLRRHLPAADPPDRGDEPQGPQQLADGREGRSRQPLGDRRARRAATTRSIPGSGR